MTTIGELFDEPKITNKFDELKHLCAKLNIVDEAGHKVVLIVKGTTWIEYGDPNDRKISTYEVEVEGDFTLIPLEKV